MASTHEHFAPPMRFELPTFDTPAREFDDYDLEELAESYRQAGWEVAYQAEGGLMLGSPDSDEDESVVGTDYIVNALGQITEQVIYYAEGTGLISDDRTFQLDGNGTLNRDRAVRLYEDDHEEVVHDVIRAFPPLPPTA